MNFLSFHPSPYRRQLTNSFLKNAFDTFQAPAWTSGQPAVNVIETPTGFRLELAAPGLSKEDFKINLQKNVLSISAQKEDRKEQEHENVHRREFSFGSFERSFRLPEAIDTDLLTANYEQGVLRIELTKKSEKAPEVKTIDIN